MFADEVDDIAQLFNLEEQREARYLPTHEAEEPAPLTAQEKLDSIALLKATEDGLSSDIRAALMQEIRLEQVTDMAWPCINFIRAKVFSLGESQQQAEWEHCRLFTWKKRRQVGASEISVTN